ncbi:unnamed protein product, partial [Owenia fusiformis]
GIGILLNSIPIPSIVVFDATEQGLIDQVIADLEGIEQFGNLENILNNVDNQIVPNLCTWAQTFATKLWSITDNIERVIALVDGRGGTFGPNEREALQGVI